MKAFSAKLLDLHMLEMDLQSLRSVKEGAEAFMRQESRLDLLINNAGVSNFWLLSRTSLGHTMYVPANNLPNADHGSSLQTHDGRL